MPDHKASAEPRAAFNSVSVGGLTLADIRGRTALDEPNREFKNQLPGVVHACFSTLFGCGQQANWFGCLRRGTSLDRLTRLRDDLRGAACARPKTLQLALASSPDACRLPCCSCSPPAPLNHPARPSQSRSSSSMERIRHSPCLNVRPGTRYPATLVVTGNHDTRVMPAHSFKFVAALQAAQAGSAPFLLRVQLSAGTAADQTRARLSAKEPMLTPSSSRPWG